MKGASWWMTATSVRGPAGSNMTQSVWHRGAEPVSKLKQEKKDPWGRGHPDPCLLTQLSCGCLTGSEISLPPKIGFRY